MKKPLLFLVLFLSSFLLKGNAQQLEVESFYYDLSSQNGATEATYLSHNNQDASASSTPLDLLNYWEDFEGANTGWVLSNGSQTNKWVIGEATYASSSHSLYISDTNGATNTYNGTAASVVHAYRDFTISGLSGTLFISFDWKGAGELDHDYMRAWLVPASYTPTPGVQITAGSGRIQLGQDYGQSSQWSERAFFFSIPAAWVFQALRLVYEWTNDDDFANVSPIAIDNINIAEITCTSPKNITATNVTTDSGTFTWTHSGEGVPVSYSYYVGTIDTLPIQPTGTTTDNTITVNGLIPSTQYYFWVRTNCSDNTKSFWSIPKLFCTGYCITSATSAEDYIESFSTTGANQNISYTASAQPDGSYADATTQIIAQQQGSSFDFNSSYFGGGQRLSIWIDWNNNQAFSDTDQVFSAYTSGDSQTGTITIPVETPLGQYRMRVRAQTGDPDYLSPNGEVDSGSTIDFTIEVADASSSTADFDTMLFKVYPNPVKDFLNISYNKDIQNIAIVNMLGQSLFTGVVNSTETEVDMTQLQTGSYLVKLTVDGVVKTIKVIKQ